MKIRVAKKVLSGDRSRYRASTLARAYRRDLRWRRGWHGVSPLFEAFAAWAKKLAIAMAELANQTLLAFRVPRSVLLPPEGPREELSR